MKTHSFDRVKIALGACAALLMFLQLHPGAIAEGKPQKSLAPQKKSVLYASSSQVIFSHAKHADTPCATCHASVASSTRARDRNTPTMSACVSCHATDHAPKIEDCKGCHAGYTASAQVGEQDAATLHTREGWRAVRPAPMIVPRPQAKLKFDHSAHTQTPCASCHGDSTTAPTMPSMASCQSCHDGKMAASSCDTCHVSSMQGAKIQTEFRDPVTGEREVLKPDDHTVDWLERHGAMARTTPDACASCHLESSCAECHQESSAKSLLAAHPPNYIVLHRVAAKGQGANCTSCHQQETSCLDCHMRSKASTIEGSKPPPRLAFHPPGWLDGASGTSHGVMARRNLNECASCHQERDCISCHQGINPHPPTFRADCKRMLKANPTPCARCHTEATCEIF